MNNMNYLYIRHKARISIAVYAAFSAISLCLMTTATNVRASEATNESHVFDCIVEPSMSVNIGSALPGVLGSMLVARNDIVEKDQVIAEIESSYEQATVDRMRARINITTLIDVSKINARYSENIRNRTLGLMTENMVASQEYERVKTEAEIANLQLREAEDNRVLAYLELLQSEANLNQRSIRSPIDGIVVDRYKTKGEYIDDKPIIKIVNIDVLHIEALLPVEFVGKIHEGMNASISLVPEFYGVHEGEVTLVDKIVDAASGTFRVRLELDNAQHEIPSGLQCEVDFHEMTQKPESEKSVAPPMYSAQPDMFVVPRTPGAVEIPEPSDKPDSVEMRKSQEKTEPFEMPASSKLPESLDEPATSEVLESTGMPTASQVLASFDVPTASEILKSFKVPVTKGASDSIEKPAASGMIEFSKVPASLEPIGRTDGSMKRYRFPELDIEEMSLGKK